MTKVENLFVLGKLEGIMQSVRLTPVKTITSDHVDFYSSEEHFDIHSKLRNFMKDKNILTWRVELQDITYYRSDENSAPIRGKMKKEGFTSFKIDGWELYSYEKVPSELEAFTKTAQERGIDALGDISDDSLIKEKNPLIRMIAEKQMGNHTYRIYLDYRFGTINRQILMCDEKWICAAEGNIGQLMAFAEYLNLNEKFGALEKLENGFFLGIHLMTDKCITCS